LTNDTGVVPCVAGTQCTPFSSGALGVCLKPDSARAVTCSDTMPCTYPLKCTAGHCAPLDPTTCAK
jgi:hypothetical protein